MNHDNRKTSTSEEFDQVYLLESSGSVPASNPGHHRWSRAGNLVHILCLYGVILFMGVAFALLYHARLNCSDVRQIIYSPAIEAVEYETRVFAENFVTKGPYMGHKEDGLPTNETDRLWDDLYQFGISQIPLSQAQLLPNATEYIPGSDDQYIIELDVFHQLHCLNTIRKALYPERYFHTFDDYFLEDGSVPGRGQRNYTSTSAKHFDHCIDAIRQSLQCHSDISTVYWRWSGPPRNVPIPRLDITHSCRNFEKIQQWGKDHITDAIHANIAATGTETDMKGPLLPKGEEPRWRGARKQDFRQSFNGDWQDTKELITRKNQRS